MFVFHLVEDSQPALSSQPISTTSIDGNVELQNVQLSTNKIKINISKNVQLMKNSINSGQSVDNNDDNLANNDEIDAIDNGNDDNSQNCNDDTIIFTDDMANNQDEIDLEFDVKESIKNVQFKQQPILRKGVEASGLCSIM